MSGRAVRKALRQREAELLKSSELQPPEEAASESDEEPPVASSKPSLFALLGADDGDQEEEGGDENEEAEPEPEAVKPEATSARKPKKKKKAKGKAKTKKEEENNGEDDIDRALRQLKISAPESVTGKARSKGTGDVPLAVVLKIDTRNLDARNEMKKLFGRDAMLPDADGDDGAGRAGGARRRGRVQMAPGAAGGRALMKGRKNTFVQPKEDWPNASSGGLGMEIDETDPATSVTTFKFVHGRAYQDVQRQFMMCVASMGELFSCLIVLRSLTRTADPQRLIMLLQHNPYHITTLLQASEIFHHQRDYSIAGDLLERALFSLGRSLHSSFHQKLSEGTVRLSFRRPENRELWLCGWRYIKNLSQRGTWRTADEFGRLLLAMDPINDPYEINLLIDFLSLKARQPERLLSLTEHPQLRKKYSDLPNIAFSSALAQRQLGEEHAAVASEYLSKAITKFPWIPNMLYQEVGIDAHLPPALWGVQPPDGNPRQEILARLYVERAKDLWKEPAASKFLVETASNIYNLPRKPLLSNASTKVSLPLARHVLLADIPPITALLPRSLTTRETSSFDPLPPDDNLASYSAALEEIPSMLRAREAGVGMRPEDGVFATFLNSLLPWFRAGQDPVGGMGEGEDAGAGGPLTEEEHGRLAVLRGELERAGFDINGLIREQEEAERMARERGEGEEDGTE